MKKTDNSASFKKSGRLGNGGFSILEALIGAVILTALGMAVSRLALSTTLSNLWNTEARKSSNLADMVFERYTIYAKKFNTLELNDAANLTAGQFFGTGIDNMGYDKMYITSKTHTEATAGVKRIEVKVTHKAAESIEGKTFVFNKFVTTLTSNIEGGKVPVLVTMHDGTPLEGVEVRAPHAAGSEATCYTDAAGMCTLENVRKSIPDNAVNIPVTVKKPGSPTDIRAAHVNYRQGYYAMISGTPEIEHIKFVNVQDQMTTALQTFDQFYPAGRITGVLQNLSHPGDDLADQVVRMTGLASNGSIDVNEPADVLTADDGAYEWNNVLPGNHVIRVRGKEPSDITVAPADDGWIRGYAADTVTLPADVNMIHPVGTGLSINARVVAMGDVRVVTKYLGTPQDDVTVQFYMPVDEFRAARDVILPTKSGGILHLYNVAPVSRVYTLWGYQIPTDCNSATGPYGFYNYYTTPELLPAETNHVPIDLLPGQKVVGRLERYDSTAMANVGYGGVKVVTNKLDIFTPLETTTSNESGSEGNYVLCGVGTLPPAYPTQSKVTFVAVNDPINVWMTGNNRIQEYHNGEPIEGALLRPWYGKACRTNCDCAVDEPVYSNSAGNFGQFCVTSPNTTVVIKTTPQTEAQWLWDPIVANTNSAVSALYIERLHYHLETLNVTLTSPGPYTNDFLMPAPLRTFPISVTVREEGTGKPLAGIPIQVVGGDFVTDSNGQVQINGPVEGRTSSSPGTLLTAGYVNVTAGPGIATNTGFNYGEHTATVNIPSTLAPYTPETVEFTLPKEGTGW